MVVAAFEKAGLRLAPTTQLLDTRPAAEDEGYFLVAAPAGILAVLAFVLLVVGRFFRRTGASSGMQPRAG